MVSMTGEGSDAAAFFTDCDTEIPDGSSDLDNHTYACFLMFKRQYRDR